MQGWRDIAHSPSLMDHRLFCIGSAGTLSCLALAWAFPQAFEAWLGPSISLACITALGIPHGALDHLLYLKAQMLSCRNAFPTRARPKGTRNIRTTDFAQQCWSFLLLDGSHPTMHRYYATYLGIMLGWIGMWYILPGPMYIAFLLISVWHFGESVGGAPGAARVGVCPP